MNPTLIINSCYQHFTSMALMENADKPLKKKVLSSSSFKQADYSSQLQGLLTQASLKLSDIEQIVIATGPGSFTGIRNSLAWLYGLTSGLAHIKTISLNPLECLLKSCSISSEDTAVIIENGRYSGFLSYYLNSKPVTQVIDFRSEEKLLCNKQLFIPSEQENICNYLKKNGLTWEEIPIERLQQNTLNAMASEALLKSPDETIPQPLYLKASTAEENLKRS